MLTSEGSIYAASKARQILFIRDDGSQTLILDQADGFAVDTFLINKDLPLLVTRDSKKGHLVVFTTRKDSLDIIEILLPRMKVCYEAAESPDKNFIAISGREDGIAFIKDGKLLTIY